MTAYLGCMRSARGDNPRCRGDARAYLECRMARNLMARDEMRNLGFWEEEGGKGDGRASGREGGGGAGGGGGGVEKVGDAARKKSGEADAVKPK
jgi:hypothetical protein